jgi:hypothetical protein
VAESGSVIEPGAPKCFFRSLKDSLTAEDFEEIAQKQANKVNQVSQLIHELHSLCAKFAPDGDWYVLIIQIIMLKSQCVC